MIANIVVYLSLITAIIPRIRLLATPAIGKYGTQVSHSTHHQNPLAVIRTYTWWDPRNDTTFAHPMYKGVIESIDAGLSLVPEHYTVQLSTRVYHSFL
jgi:hypothetical protein